MAHGYRAIYDESIVAWEREQTKAGQDFARRVRIGAGNVQQLILFAGLLVPLLVPLFWPWSRSQPRSRPSPSPTGAGRPSGKSGGVDPVMLVFVFGSGKALRVLIPFIVICGALACLYLAVQGYGVFVSIAISGALVSVLGIVAIIWPGAHVPKAVAWLGYLIEGHAASLLGAFAYVCGRRGVAWSSRDGRSSKDSSATRSDYIPWVIRAGKRTFDVVFSAIAIVLLWPLMVPIALSVKLESPGPVFYRQRRVGRILPDRAEVFDLIKIRTMYVDAEARSGPQWATENDPRITRVGSFLRKTRLDELPQFFNVLAGHMSLVGPRPERPQLIDGLERQLPFYTERTYGIRPGITGLAQISQGYDTSIEDVSRKLLYDHAYAAHLSKPLNWLAMDLRILFGTLFVMVLGRGR